MTPRSQLPAVRCIVRACPFVGHFQAYDGLCPEHRQAAEHQPLPGELTREAVNDARQA